MIDNNKKYVKLTHKEHVLHRPDMYIGSTITEERYMFICENNDINKLKISMQSVNYNSGFVKIFDEILTNASDHSIRTGDVKYIKVNIFEDHISIENDGPGIPVEIHEKEKIYIPELLFGNLLTSENYDDTEERLTGGRNGIGATLTNIYSKSFEIETADGKKVYNQKFTGNLSRTFKPKIRNSKKSYTKVTFYPDFEKFDIEKIDDEIQSILLKRTIDIAAYNPKVKVYYNGKLIPIKNFKDYINMFLDESDFIYEKINNYWEIGISTSFEEIFMQNSMVNGISTLNGGTHVNYITNQISNIIKDYILKNNKGIRIRPMDIKNNLFMFLSCKIVNPTFENQTKETLTTRITNADLKEDFNFSDSFLRRLTKSKIIEDITNRVLLKSQTQIQKELNRQNKKIKIKKLEDATMAGTYDSKKCYLFLTEGDSALSTCISGFSVVGKKYFGAFPLKGKPLNVRGEGLTKIKENEEIKNIISTIGLEFGKKYKNIDELRYGKVVVMTDQDLDGSHIKGLLINLFDNFWPELLNIDFLYEFITPIVKIEKSGRHRYFYRLDEYKKWKSENNTNSWFIKYYKGLGTIQPNEAKLFFKNINKHLIKFNTENINNRTNLVDLAFNKKRTNDRKDWLLDYKPNIEIDKFKTRQTYEKFINNELIEFSMADNLRSIPNLMDGLKPSQRKVLHTLFKKNFREQIKVSSFAGSVTETTAYHHGAVSLEGTIIGMAQDFVGSNNINLLEPKGQFGTRLKGGKDSSASRYIFTKLNDITRYIFQKEDDNLLHYLNDDGYSIEPDFYVPIIPMILVNGSDGIGTGWSSNIPKYNPKDIILYIENKINNKRKNISLIPYFKNHKGKILWDEENDRFLSRGIYEKINSTTINITELPIGVWNDKYYDFLEKLVEDKFIKDYVKNCTDTDINITIDISRENMKTLIDGNTYKILNLETYISMNNMHVFDENYKLKKFNSPEDIIDYFYDIRMNFYDKRKSYLIEKLDKEKSYIYNRIKFIRYVISDKIKIYRQPKSKIEESLENLKIDKFNDSYDYLLSMPIYSLTKEKMLELKNSYDKKKEELEIIKNKEIKNMWMDDLKELKNLL
jgi:DNA topoisomerase II